MFTGKTFASGDRLRYNELESCPPHHHLPTEAVALRRRFALSFFPKLLRDSVGRRERHKYRILGLRLVVDIAGMRSCVAR